MTRVVWTRRELVYQQLPVARQEELDAHDADHIQRFQNRACNLDGLARGLFRDARGRDGEIEYVSAVRVLYDSVVRKLASHGACRDDGDFAFEVDESLDDSLLASERFDR